MSDPIEAAARFVAAQPPGMRAGLAEHVAKADGRCAVGTVGGARIVRWPCTLAVIAERAERIRLAASGGRA